MPKIIRIFLIFFSLKNIILGAHFSILTFFKNSNENFDAQHFGATGYLIANWVK